VLAALRDREPLQATRTLTVLTARLSASQLSNLARPGRRGPEFESRRPDQHRASIVKQRERLPDL
jgi:hypothetical protein